MSTVPCEPTAAAWFGSPYDTDQRSIGTAPDWLIQFTPASVVRRMVPDAPTAIPWLMSVNATWFRAFVMPLVWADQCKPSSVVWIMAPLPPTIVPTPGAGKETPLNGTPAAWK